MVGKHIHWLLLKKHGIPTGNKWYSHVPNVVTETNNGKVTIYCNKPVKIDRKVSYNRPDVVVIDREENTWYIVSFAIPVDHHVKEKEEEKIDKYMDLAVDVRRQFRVQTMIVSIVLGAFGTVPAKLSESLKKLEIEDVTGSLYICKYIYVNICIYVCVYVYIYESWGWGWFIYLFIFLLFLLFDSFYIYILQILQITVFSCRDFNFKNLL